MHYAEDIAKYLKDPKFRDPGGYKDLLKNKDYIFTYPYTLDQELIVKVFACLNELRAMGIQVVVFIPPISDDFYDYFTKVKDFNKFFKNYLDLQDSLKARKFDFIPFTTPRRAGLSDNYMLDGIHPGEVFVGKLWYNYLRSKPLSGVLKKIDTCYLKNMIGAKRTIPLSLMIDTMVFKNHKRL
ncbi:hypothetical protein ABIB62_001189 [Mucilaginibacter sp. UYP25]|uniref:hypothetical protein n=1 Tax=unclassified Mucilaginibacter TaxID=2617802 RepID=UPI003396C6E3